MQEDAAVRSFKQAGDSGWEMTPPFPMQMLADHSPYTPSGRLPTRAIIKYDTSFNRIDFSSCPVFAKHFVL